MVTCAAKTVALAALPPARGQSRPRCGDGTNFNCPHPAAGIGGSNWIAPAFATTIRRSIFRWPEYVPHPPRGRDLVDTQASQGSTQARPSPRRTPNGPFMTAIVRRGRFSLQRRKPGRAHRAADRLGLRQRDRRADRRAARFAQFFCAICRPARCRGSIYARPTLQRPDRPGAATRIWSPPMSISASTSHLARADAGTADAGLFRAISSVMTPYGAFHHRHGPTGGGAARTMPPYPHLRKTRHPDLRHGHRWHLRGRWTSTVIEDGRGADRLRRRRPARRKKGARQVQGPGSTREGWETRIRLHRRNTMSIST